MLKTILCTCCEQYELSSMKGVKQFQFFSVITYFKILLQKKLSSPQADTQHVINNKYYWVLLTKKLFKGYTTIENSRQMKS